MPWIKAAVDVAAKKWVPQQTVSLCVIWLWGIVCFLLSHLQSSAPELHLHVNGK